MPSVSPPGALSGGRHAPSNDAPSPLRSKPAKDAAPLSSPKTPAPLSTPAVSLSSNPPSPSPVSPLPPPPTPTPFVPVLSPPPPPPSPPSPLPPSSPSLLPPPPPPPPKIPTPPAAHPPPEPLPPSAIPPSPSSASSSFPTPVLVGVGVGVVFLVAFLSLTCVFCKKKPHRRPPPENYGTLKDVASVQRNEDWNISDPPHVNHVVQFPLNKLSFDSNAFLLPPPPLPPIISSSSASGSNYFNPDLITLGFGRSTFMYQELAMATNGFSEANLLGQGGFGYVHKGILPNGREVAIKQLKSGSGQGDREFHAEVEIISRVHHKHLVSLIGYCIDGGQRLLVYEFVPNQTLEFHLHGKGQMIMDWSTRLKIALGSAKGLAYLHEDCHPKIIHRDIKASNILLDFKFEAKVADFGLAKFASDNYTHISTRVMGTFGYMAPEYASSGKLTDKSDVFSFGVVLLELLTGRTPINLDQSYSEDSLVDWARPLMARVQEDGIYSLLIDSRLGNNYNHSEAVRMVSCAAACVRHSAKLRPKMSQVVRVLEGDITLDDLGEGVRPGHGSTLSGSSSSNDASSGRYSDEMKKFRKLALGTHGLASSEISEPTSEYGRNPSSSSSSERSQSPELEAGDRRGLSGR